MPNPLLPFPGFFNCPRCSRHRPCLLACVGAVLFFASGIALCDELKLAGSCLVFDYDRNFPEGAHPQTRYAWSGVCDGAGMATGPGVLQAYWDDRLDEITTGTMLHGRLEGHAVTTSPQGAWFAGTYHQGRRNGRGIYTGSSHHGLGLRYEGEFVNGLAEGHGVESFSDGSRYEGEFLKGRRNGHGMQSGPGPQGLYYHYEGDFADDLWQGHGVLSWSNGNRYDGEFSKGLPVGPGVALVVRQRDFWNGNP